MSDQHTAMADYTLTINADSGYASTTEGRCTAAQYAAAIASLHSKPNTYTALKAMRDEMLAALIVAREFISTDRTALADCAMDPEGRMSDDDAAAVADYDKALLQIDAAIQKATGGAA